MPRIDSPVRILANKAIGAAGTADSDFIFVRGAKSVSFVVHGSDTTHGFAVANSFKILVQPHDNASIPTSVATPSDFDLEIVNATNLDSAVPSAGKIITVRPVDGKAAGMGAFKIAVRLTAGGTAITDCDVYAVVVF